MPTPDSRPGPSVGLGIYRLRTARTPRLTQQQLAERAGVSVDVIQKLEQGRKTSARLATLKAIATALGVDLSTLLSTGEHVSESGLAGRPSASPAEHPLDRVGVSSQAARELPPDSPAWPVDEVPAQGGLAGPAGRPPEPTPPSGDKAAESEEMKRRGLLSLAATSLAGALLPTDLPVEQRPPRLEGLAASVLNSVISADPEYNSRTTEVPPLQALHETVKKIRQLRVACDYANALRLMPDTIRGLHAQLNSLDWRDAARSLVLVEEAAASIVRYLGDARSSAIISDRMREAARQSEDPILLSLAAFQRTQASSAIGAYDHARTVAVRHIDDLSVFGGNRRGAAELLGMLLLTAALTCYGEGIPRDAGQYIEEARRIAKQTGNTMTLSLFFGPTNVKIWELSLETDGGDPERAIALARDIDPTAIPQIQRQATYHIDTGRALWQVDRDEDALRMLIKAERLAPLQVYHDRRVARAVRNIVERRPRNFAHLELQAFCHRLEIET